MPFPPDFIITQTGFDDFEKTPFNEFEFGGSTTINVTQPSHGFAIGEVVRFDGISMLYISAQADTSENAEVAGMVSEVIDSDNFTLLIVGEIDFLSGLNPGCVYWLSDSSAGDFTLIEPTSSGSISKPLFIATSSTNGIFKNYRGLVINSGGGGSGNISVYDEGVEIAPSANKLNFIGNDILAEVDPGDSNCVNIYIPVPPSPFVSHFNTDDGIGNCQLNNKPTTLRNISSPTSEGSPFNIGSWTGGDQRNAIRVSDSNFSYTTTNPCSFVNNSSTTIEVNIYDADGTSLLATHTTGSIVGNFNAIVQNIEITVSSFSSNSTKYQGIITVDFDIETILTSNSLTSGRFSVEIIHHNGSEGDFSFTQNDIFMDKESLSQLFSFSFSENIPIIIRKSGVYEYGLNSSFNISMPDIDNLNSDTYPDTLFIIEAPLYGLPTLNLDSSDLTGWTTDWNNINASYLNNSWNINQINYFFRGTNATVSSNSYDWGINFGVTLINQSIIVDTYSDTSTRVFEDFVSETKRIESDLSTSWDSSLLLSVADGGNGLQVGEGSYLFYPNINYNNNYEPNSSFQPDYSLLSGNRCYFTYFYHVGVSHSNGIFNIIGVTEQNIIDNDIIIEISLNGTDWFNCNEPYPGGIIINGDGCRILGLTMPQLQFTFGQNKHTSGPPNSLPHSGLGPTFWGIFVKITMPSTSSVMLDSIEITTWI